MVSGPWMLCGTVPGREFPIHALERHSFDSTRTRDPGDAQEQRQQRQQQQQQRRRRLGGASTQPACSPLTARRQPEDSRRQPRGQPNDSRRQLDDSATTARRPATPAPAPAPASAPAAATRSSVLSLCSGCVLQHTPGAQSSRIHSNAARTGAAAAAATAAAAAPTAPADPAPPSFFLYVVRLCSDSHRVPRCEQ